MSRPRPPALCNVICLAMMSAAVWSLDARAADPASSAASSETPVQAIWKPQELRFHYQSFTTYYSCSSLETKVKRLLIAVGAQPELKVRTRGCMSHHEISRMQVVDIVLSSPVAATPQELALLEKTRSTRELAARVRGDSTQAQLAEEEFPAHWQRVSLSRGELHLEPGDCDLVEQLKKKVLPQLAIKIVDDGVHCAPNQISITQPRLVVEALMPMPTPDEAAAVGEHKQENDGT